jgi:hypothetical protein
MAEAIAVIEVVVVIGEVVNGLYEYISSVKDAKDDIRKLTTELFAIKGALEHFDVQSKSAMDEAVHTQSQSMLAMTRDTLKSIEKKIGPPKSGIGRAFQNLAWPFRSDDVDKYMGRLERAKTWFIMVIMRESTDTTAAIHVEMQRLSTALHEDIITRRTDSMMKEAEELMKWLAPFDSRAELEKATVDRVPGTGEWIWDDEFSSWAEGQPSERQFRWIMGKCKCYYSLVPMAVSRYITGKLIFSGLQPKNSWVW